MNVRPAPLMLACAAPFLVSAQEPVPAALDGVELAQLIYRERVVIRIPRVSPARAPAPAVREVARTAAASAPVWTEKRAPNCISMEALTGASIDRSGEVDLVVDGGRRMRAKLNDNCPTLDFYSGFYLRQTSDGRICARRDAIRSRSGARCAITGFRTLSARK